ncbi:MAG: 7-carboxy-7-deazaguanine synthase QueE [Methanosarcinales archaeon]|nr:7-carboxy-7-deazaguanine synthase QueE [Methanosarcinales archaeon]
MTGPVFLGEIFNSIQGEGIFTGMRQVFVRFLGCPLHCNYCDTLQSRKPTAPVCKVETVPGTGEFREVPNPIDLEELVEIINELWSPATRHLSLTGGEPLEHAEFIDELSRLVDYPLYLETNGCLPGEARKVQYVVDVAACDIKLPEHNASDDYRSLLKAELETVGIFYEAGAVTFAKCVVTDRTSDDALKTIASSLSEIDDTMPLILQPVTPCPGFEPPAGGRLLELMDVAGEYLMDVRAVPQVHKMMGQL